MKLLQTVKHDAKPEKEKKNLIENLNVNGFDTVRKISVENPVPFWGFPTANIRWSFKDGVTHSDATIGVHAYQAVIFRQLCFQNRYRKAATCVCRNKGVESVLKKINK